LTPPLFLCRMCIIYHKMFHIFPTKFVYWEKIKNHIEIKEKYSKIIDQDLDKNVEIYKDNFRWDCRCNSSFFQKTNGLDLFQTDFLNSVIWGPMDNMLKDLGVSINLPSPKNSNVTKIWYNKYEVGDWQEIHDHKTNSHTVTYSGIYILELNEMNPTSFVDTNKIESWNMDENISSFYTKDIVEGSVILFPSELMHYVNPCKNSRTTISFNIFSEF